MKAIRVCLAFAATSTMFAIGCKASEESSTELPPATPVSAPEAPTVADTLRDLGLEAFSVDGSWVTWDDGIPALTNAPTLQVLLAPVAMVRTHLAEEQLASIGAFSPSKVLLRYEIIGARPTVDLNAYANSADHEPETEYVDVFALVYWGKLANNSPGLQLIVEANRDEMRTSGIKQPEIEEITVESREYRVIALGAPERTDDDRRTVVVYGKDGWEISGTKTLGQVKLGAYNLSHIDQTQLGDVVRLAQLKR